MSARRAQAVAHGHRLTGSLVTLALCAQLSGAQDASSAATAGELARGRVLFEAQCARCHGMQGEGGMGANLRRPTLLHAPNDSALVRTIAEGIPERGMPATWQLNERELRAVARYVRSLGRVTAEVVSGDTGRGREIVFGTIGGCLGCHVVRGRGGVLGPELSVVGASRGAAYLREALLDPAARSPVGPSPGIGDGEYALYLPVRITMRDGRSISGVRVAEDGFTLQLRDASGQLQSFTRTRIARIDRLPQTSLMPSYRGKLSEADIQNVVAYLATLRGES